MSLSLKQIIFELARALAKKGNYFILWRTFNKSCVQRLFEDMIPQKPSWSKSLPQNQDNEKLCMKKVFADIVLFTINQCTFDEGVFGLCLTIS